MDLATLFMAIKQWFALPTTILFFVVALFMSVRTRFIQIRALPYFIKILFSGMRRGDDHNIKTVNAFHSLFTAMATAIGVGNVVGPTLAVVIGGPGSLFWLITYIFFASATQFHEVIFGLHFRTKTSDGRILGGPARYLQLIHPWLGYWYAGVTLIIFAIWSSMQANALSNMIAYYYVPYWVTGLVLAILIFIVLRGGAQRVGKIASKALPTMCLLYLGFALFVLFSDIPALWHALGLVFKQAFTFSAPVGGFVGASVFMAIQEGTYRAVFVSEAGVGFVAIPQSLSDAKDPYDQGVLTIFSMGMNAFLCIISGLLALTTGLWTGGFQTTIVQQAFASYAPVVGPVVFVVSVSLFIFTSIIGNSLNGSLCFAVLTRYRWLNLYYLFIAGMVLWGAINKSVIVWLFSDAVLPFVAIPHLIGVFILALRYRNVINKMINR